MESAGDVCEALVSLVQLISEINVLNTFVGSEAPLSKAAFKRRGLLFD